MTRPSCLRPRVLQVLTGFQTPRTIGSANDSARLRRPVPLIPVGPDPPGGDAEEVGDDLFATRHWLEERAAKISLAVVVTAGQSLEGLAALTDGGFDVLRVHARFGFLRALRHLPLP